MEGFTRDIDTLVNEKFRTIFNLTNNYDINIFESPRDTHVIIYIRISNQQSPRGKVYQKEEYITPPGTPRELDEYIEDSPRDELCVYLSTYKNEFINFLQGVIIEYFTFFIKDSLEIKFNIDRISIKFKNGL